MEQGKDGDNVVQKGWLTNSNSNCPMLVGPPAAPALSKMVAAALGPGQPRHAWPVPDLSSRWPASERRSSWSASEP
jgi:hypothetical protein